MDAPDHLIEVRNLRQTISVSVTRDGKTGSYAANDFDDASLKDAVKKAEELAALAPPNSERLPALGPQTYPVINDLDPATAKAQAGCHQVIRP